MELKNQKGFTLIELVIVMVIIGILMAVVIPRFLDLSTQAKVAQCAQNRAAIESACTIYYSNLALSGATADYPADIATLVTATLLDATPVCKGGGTYSTVGGKAYCSTHFAAP